MDLLISGKPDAVTRARAAIASRLTTLGRPPDGQRRGAGDRGPADAASADRRRRARPAAAVRRGRARPSSPTIDQALATIRIPYEEWEVLYRQRLQVERDLRAGAMAGEAVLGAEQPGRRRRAARWPRSAGSCARAPRRSSRLRPTSRRSRRSTSWPARAGGWRRRPPTSPWSPPARPSAGRPNPRRRPKRCRSQPRRPEEPVARPDAGSRRAERSDPSSDGRAPAMLRRTMNEALHIDRIAEAGVAWESAVKSYVRTWGRPADDGVVTPAEWRASEAERAAARPTRPLATNTACISSATRTTRPNRAQRSWRASVRARTRARTGTAARGRCLVDG